MPLLLITGKDDFITPPQMAEKLFHNSISQQKHLLIIKNGGHNNLPEMEIYGKALKRFYHPEKEMQVLQDSLIDSSSQMGL